MCFLFKFGNYLLVSILCDWLDVYGLVNLEISVGNEYERYMLFILECRFPKLFQSTMKSLFPLTPLLLLMFEWCNTRGFDPKRFECFEVCTSVLSSVKYSRSYRSKLYAQLKSVRALLLNNCETPEYMLVMSEMVRNCPLLEGLTVTNSLNVIEVCIVLAKRGSSTLTALDFSGCTTLTEYAMALLLNSCPNINKLNVSGCFEMSRIFMEALIVRGLNVRYLYISNAFQIVRRLMIMFAFHSRKELIEFRSDQCVNELIMLFYVYKVLGSELKLFDLSNCRYNLTDGGVRLISLHSPQMTSLSMAYCRRVTNDGVSSLILNMPLITQLNLSNVLNVEDSCLLIISVRCPHLTSVNVAQDYRITNIGVLSLFKNLTHLKDINISSLPQLTSTELQHILDAFHLEQSRRQPPQKLLPLWKPSSTPQRCAKLTSLSLSNLSLYDITLINIVRCVSELHYLDISSNMKLTDKSIKCVAKYGSSNLHHLNLSQCELLTNTSLEELALHCPRLTVLNIDECVSIVDNVGIDAILSSCKKMKKITAEGISLTMWPTFEDMLLESSKR